MFDAPPVLILCHCFSGWLHVEYNDAGAVFVFVLIVVTDI